MSSVVYSSVRLPLFAFVFRSSLPDVLSRPGFDKKLLLMSPLRYESCYDGQRLLFEGRYKSYTGREVRREGRGTQRGAKGMRRVKN